MDKDWKELENDMDAFTDLEHFSNALRRELEKGNTRWYRGDVVNEVIVAATAAERERCARVAEDFATAAPFDYTLLEALAAAIRKGENDD
jgi:hypothetical protein